MEYKKCNINIFGLLPYSNENNKIHMSFLSLPDISQWDTSQVKDMSYMFYECSLLKSLPDISKWDT